MVFYYRQHLLYDKKLSLPKITINKSGMTFCMCVCVTVCSVLQWVIASASALANVCFDSAHLCDPLTIIHIYSIILNLFHANPYDSCTVPLRNLPLFYFIQLTECFFNLTKSDKMSQACELSIGTVALTTNERNNWSHAMNILCYVSLVNCE